MTDMTGALFYFTTAIISVVAFILGIVAGRASRQKSICWIAIALALILFKAVLHAKPVWEASLFPWVGYVYLQSYWLYPLGLFFFGMVYDGQKVTVLDPLINSATQVSIDHVLSDLSGATVVVLPPEDR